MGALVRYLQGLRPGEEIDSNISQIIFRGRFAVDTNRDETIDEKLPVRIGYYHAAYLPWGERTVSCINVEKSEDVISRPFSGCYMARIPKTMGGCECYHIHTDENVVYDRKNFWNKKYIPFVKSREEYQLYGGVLFRPSVKECKVSREKTITEVWGIISHDGKCYSVLVYKNTNGNWAFANLTTNVFLKGRLLIPY